jgi:hypothetical protein
MRVCSRAELRELASQVLADQAEDTIDETLP